ncbi:MAG: hypothetical protein F6K28_48305 [Microcoleus sp. SIO2G3]|nr:hypothetical protein [Microcoleus sp. SIO2G3]
MTPPVAPSPPFLLTPQQAAELLAVSTDTIDRLRSDPEVGWVRGVHWNLLPRGGYRYNAELLKDWWANAHDPEAHQRAIENFQASLLSNKKRRRSA